jgi:uncharacterized protein (TIGR03083 family)
MDLTPTHGGPGDLAPERLLALGFDAVEAGAPPLPGGLGGAVRAAALGARRARHDGWRTSNGDLSALEAFVQTAAELSTVLAALTPHEWARPTRAAGAATVHDVAVHLVGVERYVLGQLGARPAIDAATRDLHAAATRAAAAELLTVPGPDVAREWWAGALEVARVCGGAGPEEPVAYHDLPGSVRGLMTVRTFELWTHGDDITGATGRGRNPLDGPRLALMSGELAAVLPFGMALTGGARPGTTARLELTGPGGGHHLVPLAPGEAPGEPTVTLTAPVIEVCRLAANRLAIGDLTLTVTGDASLVEPILIGAGAFAMD